MVLGKNTNFSPKPYHLMSDALIFDALRTPRGRGKTNGSLYEVKPLDLLGTALEKLRLFAADLSGLACNKRRLRCATTH